MKGKLRVPPPGRATLGGMQQCRTVFKPSLAAEYILLANGERKVLCIDHVICAVLANYVQCAIELA